MKYWLLAFAIIGTCLRLSHPLEIEFKGDERFMLEQATSIGRTAPWPSAGMPSGVGLRNPPLSIWSFVGLSRTFGLETPQALSMGVAAWNALGLLALSIWIYRTRPHSLMWTLGLCLAWVSPQALLLERKIWAQSLLPGLMAWLWIIWPYRARPWAGALLGLGLGLSGQIHMSGFFLAAALLLQLLATTPDRRLLAPFAAGLSVSAFPIIPWLTYLLSPEGRAALAATQSYGTLPHSTFDFWRHLFNDTFGTGLDYSLGGHLPAFIQKVEPLHLWIRSAQALFVGLTLLLGIRGRRGPPGGVNLEGAQWIIGATTLTGLLLLIPGTPVYRHYLVLIYPAAWLLPGLLASHACEKNPRWERVILGLGLVVAALQAVESASLLSFLEQNRGAPGADFGVSLRGLLETGK